MSEDTKLDVYVGCGVRRGHCGQDTGGHTEWPELIGHWLKTIDSISILTVVQVRGILGGTRWPIGNFCSLNTDASYGVTGADRTLAEDRRSDEYFGCCIGKGWQQQS